MPTAVRRGRFVSGSDFGHFVTSGSSQEGQLEGPMLLWWRRAFGLIARLRPFPLIRVPDSVLQVFQPGLLSGKAKLLAEEVPWPFAWAPPRCRPPTPQVRSGTAP